MRRQLTDEEREIRKSRGIPIGRLWPFALMLAADLVISFDTRLFVKCTGNPLYGRGGGEIRPFAAIFCSPYYLHDSLFHLLMFVSLWGPIPFAIFQILWMKRHEAYWDTVRAREKIKRAEKRASKNRSDIPS
ncbi:MAG TPA: hypothetical protein VMU22_16665 [Rhizomicrobium sp.]|nr:hypothetical protein [Rhizomicrobium sp.]